jgi:dTDP-4-dehydrorhamnose reductase
MTEVLPLPVSPRFLITGLNGVTGWNLFQSVSARFACQGTFRKDHSIFKPEGFTKLDFEDPSAIEQCLQKWQPTHVIHSWAMCDLDLCEVFPEMARKINVLGTDRLIQALAALPSLQKLVFISTDHVFDGERGGYTENDLPIPKHVFGRTRREAELHVLESGLPALVIRPGLVIGQSFQGNKGPRDFLLRRIRSGKQTHYFTDEWRSPIRTADLGARVVELALSGREGIVHVAGQTAMNRYELARTLAVEAGLATDQILPRLRAEDRWAHIRPKDLSLTSIHPHPLPPSFLSAYSR